MITVPSLAWIYVGADCEGGFISQQTTNRERYVLCFNGVTLKVINATLLHDTNIGLTEHMNRTSSKGHFFLYPPILPSCFPLICVRQKMWGMFMLKTVVLNN